MSDHEKNQTTRRGFLGSIAGGAAAMGLPHLLAPLQQVHASPGSTFHVPEDPAEKILIP